MKTNIGKCHMRLFRYRHRDKYLVFYCDREDHDHGVVHPILKKVTAESIIIPAQELYEQMTGVQ